MNIFLNFAILVFISKTGVRSQRSPQTNILGKVCILMINEGVRIHKWVMMGPGNMMRLMGGKG